MAKIVYRVQAKPGQTIKLSKAVVYHTSRGVPVKELSDRCRRTLDRVAEVGIDQQFADQRAWMDAYWARCDVEIPGQPEVQQAVRWNLFQLAQAAGRAEGMGIPAKGVSGSGYGGHYFWDTEVYVMPFLTYTSPMLARNALRFRYGMLPAAVRRAKDLQQDGALFPWRTINGEEASAYYAAGTAQYHIDADISYALSKYVDATGDEEFLAREAIDILVQTARMWADLGFWSSNGDSFFHIHGVTGPDEYTTVVNNNLFTNVMARYNLRRAAAWVEYLQQSVPEAYDRMVARLNLDPDEVEEWLRAGRGMCIPFDDDLGIHPQDSALPRARGLGPAVTGDREATAAPALSPAGDLPLPGAEAGRRGPRVVPAGPALHGRAEAQELRVLRPDHHGRLDLVGGRAVDHRRRGRL